MKKLVFYFSFLLLAFILFHCNMVENKKKNSQFSDAEINNYIDSISYLIGNEFGTKLKFEGLDTIISRKAFYDGINDGLDDKIPKISSYFNGNIIENFYKELETRKLLSQFGSIKMEGEEFLEKNSKKAGVTTLESGLQYKIIKEGEGEVPQIGDTLLVSYKGSLIEGTVFDQASKDNPYQFVYGKSMIPGWNQAIGIMKEGSHYEVYIPQDLAYGSDPPRRSTIKPFTALIFEIEILKIKRRYIRK